MALSTSSNKVIHSGNGVATSFAYTFPILEASHLQVIYADTGGNAITLSPSLYSVTGIGGLNGGAVTYPLTGPALASGETLTLLREVPLTQLTVLSNQGGYYPEIVEARFDRIYMALQQLDEQIGRATLDPPSVQRADVVATLEDLKALTARPAAVIVKTGSAAGEWQWEAGSATTADDALVVECTSGDAGRYKRIVGESIEADWFSTAQAAAATAYGKVFVVPPGETLTVATGGPSLLATIHDALEAIHEWAISPTGWVKITVPDGIHSYTETIRFDHPHGARIGVEGNITTPGDCVLQFTGNIAGVYARDGAAIGGFNGFRLEKVGTKENVGVLVDNGAIAHVGPNLEIDNFYYGIAARLGSRVSCTGTSPSNRVLVTNAGDVGIWSFVGSAVNCRYAKVDTVADVPNNLGFGFMTEYGSAMDCELAEATGCRRAGFASYSGSGMRTYNTNTHDNGGNGYETALGGSLTAHGGVSKDNGAWGAMSDGSSRISANPAITYSGNASGTYREPINFDSSDNTIFRGNIRNIKASPNIKAQATAGDAWFTVDAVVGGFAFFQALIAGAERGRLQYRDDVDMWELAASGKTLLRAADTGKVTIGAANPANTATAGFLQIPSCAGAPTGVVADIEGGYVGLVWNRTDKKFMVYDGGWLGGTNPGVFS